MNRLSGGFPFSRQRVLPAGAIGATPHVGLDMEASHSQVAGDILYIMGTGRSGTTILDMLLSNQKGVLGCGEITHSFAREARSDQCSCGRVVETCPVWTRVFGDYSEEENLGIHALLRKLEAHGRFPLIALRLLRAEDRAVYRRVQEHLFRALFAQGDRAVVDSSKYASRALLLREIFGQRLKVIGVTRCPEGIINSFAKTDTEQPAKSLWGTFFYYLYTMTCIAIVKGMLGDQVVMVRYEDLIGDPLATLEKIEKGFLISLSDTRRLLLAGEPLDPGHMAVGNRLRRQKRVYFKQGEKPAKVQGAARLASFLMRCYCRIIGFGPQTFTRGDS